MFESFGTCRHLEELHRMGVTMLRAPGELFGSSFAGIDAALYMESELVSRFLNRFPWDVVYQVYTQKRALCVARSGGTRCLSAAARRSLGSTAT